jgi:hypothetical protein
MTQAFNLSQFANKVNTSGQADLTTAVTGTLPIANGGTNNNTLAVTAGGALYTDGSKVVNVGAGSSGEVLTSQGAGAPIWQTPQGGFANMQVFTGSGTFTIPAGVTKVKVTVVGGGGNGANGGSALGSGGGGGGGGGAAIEIISGLTPLSTVSVTVGGVAGTSSFGAYCSATGGASGSGGTAGAGGVGSGGQLNIGGAHGTWPTSTSGSSAAYGEGGNGGSSFLGGGGSANTASNNGTSGQSYGGGGGGGSTSGGSGGSGAAGVVFVEY